MFKIPLKFAERFVRHGALFNLTGRANDNGHWLRISRSCAKFKPAHSLHRHSFALSFALS